MGLFDRFKSNNIEDYGKAFKEYYENDKFKKAEKLLESWEKQHPKDSNLYYAKSIVLVYKIAEKSESLSKNEIRDAINLNTRFGSEAMALDVRPMSDEETNKWFANTYMGNGLALNMLMM